MRMRSRAERIFRLGDEIEAIRREETRMAEELNMHRHLRDDAVRDAAVSDHPFDRMDAEETSRDVARAQRNLEQLRATRDKLERKRERLLRKMG